MEPFRPFVDLLVFNIWQQFDADREIDEPIRKELLSMVQFKLYVHGEVLTLQAAITKAAQSLSKAVAGEGNKADSSRSCLNRLIKVCG